MGNKSLSIPRAFRVVPFPAGFAQIEALDLVLQIKKHGVIRLLITELLAATLTGMRTALDVPIVHQFWTNSTA
jgi:hypothetical protein